MQEKLNAVYGEKIKVIVIGVTRSEENYLDRIFAHVCHLFVKGDEEVINRIKNN